MQRILDTMHALDGVLELAPGPGSDFPELSWGDRFFFYAPDGVIPSGQPYATIVTKDYPGDELSALGDGRWRVNVQVGRARAERLVGAGPHDLREKDVLLPHPVYGGLGWIAVVNPAERTMPLLLDLVRAAHEDARRRRERRDTTGS